jgi:hypothetical protein
MVRVEMDDLELDAARQAFLRILDDEIGRARGRDLLTCTRAALRFGDDEHLTAIVERLTRLLEQRLGGMSGSDDVTAADLEAYGEILALITD